MTVSDYTGGSSY